MTNDVFWNDDREKCFGREDALRAKQPTYDPGERAARFGEAVIDFANTIAQPPVTLRQNLAERRMSLIPSSLVIRHSSFY